MTDEDRASEDEPHFFPRPMQPVRRIALRRFMWSASLLLLFLVALCYAGRWDEFAAVTVFPAWCWLVPGLALWMLGTVGSRLAWWGLAVGWIAFALTFGDAPGSLLRPVPDPPTARPAEVDVRVLSLNCGSAGWRAVAELKDYSPDVVLLQEAPPRADVARLVEELFGTGGGFRVDSDTAVLARGEVHELSLDMMPADYCTTAEVRLPDGRRLAVVSLRLEPNPVRFDWYRGDAWRHYTSVRQRQREQLQALVAPLFEQHADVPLVLGGDFNAPPGDAIFRQLHPELVDSYTVAGRGLGNTFMNDVPLLRIDAVWVSKRFSPLATYAVATRASDHRLVVCDLGFSR